jgi:hypothetical protein
MPWWKLQFKMFNEGNCGFYLEGRRNSVYDNRYCYNVISTDLPFIIENGYTHILIHLHTYKILKSLKYTLLSKLNAPSIFWVLPLGVWEQQPRSTLTGWSSVQKRNASLTDKLSPGQYNQNTPIQPLLHTAFSSAKQTHTLPPFTTLPLPTSGTSGRAPASSVPAVLLCQPPGSIRLKLYSHPNWWLNKHLTNI